MRWIVVDRLLDIVGDDVWFHLFNGALALHDEAREYFWAVEDNYQSAIDATRLNELFPIPSNSRAVRGVA